jgi:hypothetical protein
MLVLAKFPTRPVHIFRRKRLDRAIAELNSDDTPKKTKSRRYTNLLSKRRLENAINHAKYICKDYEDTDACRAAWSIVEEIAAAEHDLKLRSQQRKILSDDDIDMWEILSEREYDM